MGPDGFGSGFACPVLGSVDRAIWTEPIAVASVGNVPTTIANTMMTTRNIRMLSREKTTAPMRFRPLCRSIIRSFGLHFLPFRGSSPHTAGTPLRKDRTMDDGAHGVRIIPRTDHKSPRRADKEPQLAGRIGSSIGRPGCRYLRNRGKAVCSVS